MSRYAASLLDTAPRSGRSLGHGYVQLDAGVVLAVEPPDAPRLPNGLAARLWRCSREELLGAEVWNARPVPRFGLAIRPRVELDLERLVGLGPGMTPLGDDVLAGYLAGRSLYCGETQTLPDPCRTTALSATLLRLAAAGELPEPAHALLEGGDPEPLLAFGATSGKGLIVGLALGCPTGRLSAGDAALAFDVRLPFPESETTYRLEARPLRLAQPGRHDIPLR